MRPPRIGIPLTLDDRERWRVGRQVHYIDRSYADAVARAGGIALQLPIQEETSELVNLLDGLLLPGGDDFLPGAIAGTVEGGIPSADPALPGIACLDPVPPAQLAFDRKLVEAARSRGLPIFGICYGMQLLSLLSGGELHYHLPSECPDLEEHRRPDPDARHEVRLEPTSRLAAALGCRRWNVNTLHHQAVRSVGPHHRVVARSPDGVIEAIESRTPEPQRPAREAGRDPAVSWELGVQWHPEKLPGRESDLLFRHFIETCKAASRP